MASTGQTCWQATLIVPSGILTLSDARAFTFAHLGLLDALHAVGALFHHAAHAHSESGFLPS